MIKLKQLIALVEGKFGVRSTWAGISAVGATLVAANVPWGAYIVAVAGIIAVLIPGKDNGVAE